MPVVSAPRLRLWPPRVAASKPAAAARACTMRATVRGSIGWVPTVGGRGMPPRAGGSQMRRNSGPVGDAGGVLPAAQRAHRAEFGGAERQGDGDALAVAVALGERQGEAQPARGGFQVLHPDRRQLGPAQRAGEAHQQQGAVAQAAQVVADRGEDLAQHADRGGEFLRRELAALRGVAADAGQRLADHRLGGRHGAAGEVVQIADRGAAQVDGGDRQAALALGGEERHDVGGGRGQAGQRVAGAPGAPGGDPGAVGAPRVGGLGQPGEGVGGGARGRQAAVERRQWGGDGAVEPAAHLDRRRAERRRDGVRQRIRRAGRGVGRASASALGADGSVVARSPGAVMGVWRSWRVLGGFGRFSRARLPEIAMPDKGTYRA